MNDEIEDGVTTVMDEGAVVIVEGPDQYAAVDVQVHDLGFGGRAIEIGISRLVEPEDTVNERPQYEEVDSVWLPMADLNRLQGLLDHAVNVAIGYEPDEKSDGCDVMGEAPYREHMDMSMLPRIQNVVPMDPTLNPRVVIDGHVYEWQPHRV